MKCAELQDPAPLPRLQPASPAPRTMLAMSSSAPSVSARRRCIQCVSAWTAQFTPRLIAISEPLFGIVNELVDVAHLVPIHRRKSEPSR